MSMKGDFYQFKYLPREVVPDDLGDSEPLQTTPRHTIFKTLASNQQHPTDVVW